MEASAHGGEADGGVTRELPRVEPAGPGPAPESGAAAQSDGSGDLFAERPEYFVGAAFVGGLLAAKILRRLGR